MNSMRSKENRVHTFDTKPFSCYECVIPDYFNCVPMHWHSEFEINFILEGSAEFICGDEKFISNKGDIIITQPNVMHSIYAHDGMRQVYSTLVFSSTVFGNTDLDRYMAECITPLISGNIHIQTHITPQHHYYYTLRTSIENIFSCAKGNTPQLDMLMRSELIRLFWLLETEAEVGLSPHSANEIIRPALDYIANNFDEVITIKQLADSVHLSESHFIRQFQKYVGFSPIKYLLHYRVTKACKALVDTQKNVSEIAFDCGFHNLSNFNRQFKEIVGCSPLQYRKRNTTITKL